jgi:hypothetical protein
VILGRSRTPAYQPLVRTKHLHIYVCLKCRLEYGKQWISNEPIQQVTIKRKGYVRYVSLWGDVMDVRDPYHCIKFDSFVFVFVFFSIRFDPLHDFTWVTHSSAGGSSRRVSIHILFYRFLPDYAVQHHIGPTLCPTCKYPKYKMAYTKTAWEAFVVSIKCVRYVQSA